MQTYNTDEQRILLGTARASIKFGLENRTPLKVKPEDYSTELQQTRASFVTLQNSGNLRGCIGSLAAHMPLIQDVAQNSYSAPFRDPRFPPLTTAEFDNIDIHISVLSPSEPIKFSSEQDLLSKIRPNVDGLILSAGKHRGTFLPSVWKQLPEPLEFMQHLKNKAGLPKDYWSDNIRVERYTTETIE